MVTIEPKLSVWNEPYGTIDQVARALADAGGGFTYDQAYAKILSAIWLGKFERDGNVHTFLPGLFGGCRQAADGSFVASYQDDKTPRVSDEPITREDLRNALYGNDARAKTQKDMLPFEELAVKRPGEFDLNFRRAYLDPLVIETEAAEAWQQSLHSNDETGQSRKTEASVSEPIYYSGGAGRPSSMHLVLAEARQRIAADDVPATKGKFSEQLATWLTNAHPRGHPLTPKAIGNNSDFSELYRNWKRQKLSPK